MIIIVKIHENVYLRQTKYRKVQKKNNEKQINNHNGKKNKENTMKRDTYTQKKNKHTNQSKYQTTLRDNKHEITTSTTTTGVKQPRTPED